MTHRIFEGWHSFGRRLVASERAGNPSERDRFKTAALDQPHHIRAFCLTLLYTGCRLSEARFLERRHLQDREGLIAIKSLKKRSILHIREIPVPASLIQSLLALAATTECTGFPCDGRLWISESGAVVDRVVAYRWVKRVMKEAGISGPQACPKGLRHSFGLHAVLSGVPLNMIQKWMGHASIHTTAIYANAVGPEEMEIAKRMW